MKAAPLLRAWQQRLRMLGVRVHARHRLVAVDVADGQPALTLVAPGGEVNTRFDAAVLAMGGASWPQLGSDGSWLPWLKTAGAEIAPLRPSNCGFDVVPRWSEHLRDRFAGAPLKGVRLHWCIRAGRRATSHR